MPVGSESTYKLFVPGLNISQRNSSTMLMVFKGVPFRKRILVLKELTRLTCCKQFRLLFKRFFEWKFTNRLPV